MPARALSDCAARTALAAHFAPGQLAADLAKYTPAEVRARRVRSDSSGLLASYRPSDELARAELTCPFVIPTDEERPTALTDLGPACPPGLWVRSRERLGRLTDSTVAVTGNRAPTTRQALGTDATAGKATPTTAPVSPPRPPSPSTAADTHRR